MSFNGPQLLEITLENFFIKVRLGNQQVTVSGPLKLDKGSWNHVAIVFVNVPSSSSTTVNIYVNGRRSEQILPRGVLNTPFLFGQRTSNFVARCPNSPNNKIGSILFDEFKIYDRALIPQEIEQFAKNRDIPISPHDSGLVVYFPFKEGKGKSSVGIAGPKASESYLSTFNAANFVSRNDASIIKCQSTGDPHVVDFYANKWDPEHKKHLARIVSCDEGKITHFEVVSDHDFGHPSHPKATLNRQVRVRLNNDVVRVLLGGKLQYRQQISKAWVDLEKVNQDVGELKIRVDGKNYYIYGAPYGFARIVVEGTTHMNVYIEVVKNVCNSHAPSHCAGYKGFINEWEYDFDVIINPPLFPPLASPPQKEEVDPCESFPDLKVFAEEICFKKYRNVTKKEYEDCVFDICGTGDPGIGTEIPDEECMLEYRRLIEEGKEDEAANLDCGDNCNCLVGECKEVDGVKQCVCEKGYTGKDCSQSATLVNITVAYDGVVNGKPYHISPHKLTGLAPNSAVSLSPNDFAQLNSWDVKDTFLIYVTSAQVHNIPPVNKRSTEPGEFKNSYSLFVIGEGKHTPHKVSWTLSPNGVAPVGYGTLGKVTLAADMKSAQFNFDGYNLHGLVFKELPDEWCVDFNFGTLPSTIRQVVIGSGNNDGYLDIIKVHKNGNENVRVCGNEILNPCANINSCEECMAEEVCGWCRSTSRCIFGNAGGPIDGSVCPYWQFTASPTTSRRVKAYFGAPINPKKQEVFLVTGDHELATLPVQIVVDAGYSRDATWDIAVLTPPTGPAFTAFTGMVPNILTYLDSIEHIGFSYSFIGKTSPTLVSTLETPKAALHSLLFQISKMGPQDPTTNLPASLIGLTNGQSPGWREHARHLTVVIPDTIVPPTDTQVIANIRNALLDRVVLPLFAVKQSQLNAYRNFVAELGFGIVIQYDHGSNLLDVILEGIERATGSVSLVPRSFGHLNQDDVAQHSDGWTISGLGEKMRTRMYFPFKADEVGGDGKPTIEETNFVAPGFGKASVINIETDLPIGTSTDVNMRQYDTLESNEAISGRFITFSGRGLELESPVYIKFEGHSEAYVPYGKEGPYQVGKFYQVDDEKISQITNQDEIDSVLEEIPSSGAFIKDPAGRVLYVPHRDGYSVSGKDDSPYVTVTYTVYDACTKSEPFHLNIYITYQNIKPESFVQSGLGGDENTAIVLQLHGKDEKGHLLDYYITKGPHEISGNSRIPKGRFYKYSDDLYSQLNVQDIYELPDLEAILSTGEQIIASPESPVLINGDKVIYIPDRFFNSENIPASGKYQTLPEAEFFVKQREHLEEELDEIPDGETYLLLKSIETPFKIYIKWVNQKPYIGGESHIDVLHPIVPDDTVCYHLKEDCDFDQNLGVFPPNQAPPATLLVGGYDIEEVPLKLKIKSLECPQGTVLKENLNPIFVDDIVPIETGVWSPALRFRPEKDRYRDGYCIIEYVITDGQLESEVAKLTLNVKHINQPPFSINRIYLLTNSSTYTSDYYVYDYEETEINARIMKCDVPIPDEDYSLVINGVDVKCSAITEEGISLGVINTTPRAEFTVEYSFDITKFDGGNIQIAYIQFDDGLPRNIPLNTYKLTFTYIAVNKFPEIWRYDESQKTTSYFENFTDTALIVNETIFDIGLTFSDDAVLSSNMRMDCYITPFDTPQLFLGNYHNVYILPTYGVNNKLFTAEGNRNNLAQFLQQLRIAAMYEGDINITFVINDLGNSGACSESDIMVCDKISNATLLFRAVLGSETNSTIIAAGSAGAILVAGAAAAIAWFKVKKLRNNSEAVNPWMLEGDQDNVIDNPMYESTGNEGENPLYDDNIE